MIQWLASGITNAEAAEVEANNDYEHALSLMSKALYCFRQANNAAFTRKAMVQAESFRLRDKLLEAGNYEALSSENNAASRSEFESEAVKLMENLMKQNMLLEVQGLGRDLRKFLRLVYPSSSFLESTLLQHLPGGGYAY